MGAKAYTPQEKLRIVAWALFRGAPDAAQHFGVDIATVRKWVAEQPDDDHLRVASDLALSELAGDILDGKQRHKLPTAAGILADKAARYYRAKEPEPKKSPEDDALDALMTAINERYGDLADLAIPALLDWARATGAASIKVPAALDYLASLGPLDEWWVAREQRRHDEMLEQLDRNDAMAVLARAEAYLKATA